MGFLSGAVSAERAAGLGFNETDRKLGASPVKCVGFFIKRLIAERMAKNSCAG